MPFVEISPSLRTYYESSGIGPPVVLIHPPHMGQTVFKYQQELSDWFQVITYDIRGHGRSESSHETVTIPLLAGDLLAFLDALEIERAILVGYSAGGSIAQEFALTYPDRVQALILSGGFPEVSTFALNRQYQFGMSLVRNGRSELLSKLLAFSHKVTDEDQRVLLDECLQADPQSAYDYYRESRNYQCTDRLATLPCRLLLVYGQFSHVRPYVNLYKQRVPQMESILVSNSLHQVPIKKYRPFNQALRGYLERL